MRGEPVPPAFRQGRGPAADGESFFDTLTLSLSRSRERGPLGATVSVQQGSLSLAQGEGQGEGRMRGKPVPPSFRQGRGPAADGASFFGTLTLSLSRSRERGPPGRTVSSLSRVQGPLSLLRERDRVRVE